MDPKVFLLFTAFFLSVSCYAQTPDNFGKLLPSERTFKSYPADSSANAVVLFEKGNTYFDIRANSIWLIKKYHGKIKILNEKGFGEGNIAIPIYKNNDSGETIEDIRAITHNDQVKTGLQGDQIFTVDVNEWYSEKRFTFPNIKKGSILEYQYTTVSPFLFKLDGWSFQSHIPKVYSEFNAKIPSNYHYNRTLLGSIKLTINDASIKKNCFYVDGFPNPADCEVLKYAMKDIPAFNTDGAFMLAPSNYISRLDFELSEYISFSGAKTKYTKTWKDVDRDFKKDKDIGRQLTKKSFFEKNVPEELLTKGDELNRAQHIFAFVRNHYTWNGNYGIYDKVRVKDAFNKKVGNVGEINISLINLLHAAGIKTNLMLLSTRQHGLPKKNHPVLSDFNYVVAKITVNGVDYLLDATDKTIPFGMLPYRCLNYQGRVMDFKKESYWYDIKAHENNKIMFRAKLEFNPKEEKFKGTISELNLGYHAISKRREISENDPETYLKNMERAFMGDFFITSHRLDEKEIEEKKVLEQYDFEIEKSFDGKIMYFNPFFFKFFEKNPFVAKKRNYPIDFGYKRNYVFHVNITIPKGYRIKDIPKKKLISLPEQMGTLKFDCRTQGNSLTLLFDLSLKSPYYRTETYPLLQEFFKQIIDVQNNTLIVFEKV